MTNCMAKEAPTVSFLVKYEVPTVVSNDNDLWNVTVRCLRGLYQRLCGSCNLYHPGILCNPNYITTLLDHDGGSWIPCKVSNFLPRYVVSHPR
jgi:hypothetical protein